MKEFKINQYITLKLIDGKTTIFVNGEEFKQCKYLLLNIPVNEIRSLRDIESIDEAAGRLDSSQESQRFKTEGFEIPPEVEFWAHCSNIQVWAENNYNSNILHRNIAFPLLKKLADVGDFTANKIFREEIAIRALSQHDRTVHFLVDGRYLNNLSKAEIKNVIFQGFELKRVETLLRLFKRGYFKIFTNGEIDSIFEEYYQKLMESKNNEIRQVSCELFEHIALSFIKQQFESKEFYFAYEKESTHEGHILALEIRSKYNLDTNITEIRGLKYLIKLKRLTLTNFQVTDINPLKMMVELESLDLSNCKFSEIKGMRNFQHLRKLILFNNQIEEITGISTLTNLEVLNLGYNNISKMNSLKELRNLKELKLSDNNIKEIIGLDNLINLNKLNLSNNEIEEIKGLENLISLEELNLSVNQIRKIQGFNNLKNLRVLDLSYNPIKDVENLDHLKKLKNIGLLHTKVVYTKKLGNFMRGKFVGLNDYFD